MIHTLPLPSIITIPKKRRGRKKKNDSLGQQPKKSFISLFGGKNKPNENLEESISSSLSPLSIPKRENIETSLENINSNSLNRKSDQSLLLLKEISETLHHLDKTTNSLEKKIEAFSKVPLTKKESNDDKKIDNKISKTFIKELKKDIVVSISSVLKKSIPSSFSKILSKNILNELKYKNVLFPERETKGKENINLFPSFSSMPLLSLKNEEEKKSFLSSRNNRDEKEEDKKLSPSSKNEGSSSLVEKAIELFTGYKGSKLLLEKGGGFIKSFSGVTEGLGIGGEASKGLGVVSDATKGLKFASFSAKPFLKAIPILGEVVMAVEGFADNYDEISKTGKVSFNSLEKRVENNSSKLFDTKSDLLSISRLEGAFGLFQNAIIDLPLTLSTNLVSSLDSLSGGAITSFGDKIVDSLVSYFHPIEDSTSKSGLSSSTKDKTLNTQSGFPSSVTVVKPDSGFSFPQTTLNTQSGFSSPSSFLDTSKKSSFNSNNKSNAIETSSFSSLETSINDINKTFDENKKNISSSELLSNLETRINEVNKTFVESKNDSSEVDTKNIIEKLRIEIESISNTLKENNKTSLFLRKIESDNTTRLNENLKDNLISSTTNDSLIPNNTKDSSSNSSDTQNLTSKPSLPWYKNLNPMKWNWSPVTKPVDNSINSTVKDVKQYVSSQFSENREEDNSKNLQASQNQGINRIEQQQENQKKSEKDSLNSYQNKNNLSDISLGLDTSSEENKRRTVNQSIYDILPSSKESSLEKLMNQTSIAMNNKIESSNPVIIPIPPPTVVVQQSNSDSKKPISPSSPDPSSLRDLMSSGNRFAFS